MEATKVLERVGLVELMNNPLVGFEHFLNQLKRLEQTGRKLVRSYRSPEARKLKKRLEFGQQDLILSNLRGKGISEKYSLFQELEVDVNAKLKHYASAPVLFFDIPTRGWGSVESWQERNAKEHFGIRYLVRLVTAGKINKIRRCERKECRQWFVASRGRQKCCREWCRKKMESEENRFKARRRRYMKTYRATGGRIG